MSGGTQRRALSEYQKEEMKILKKSYARVRIELITCRLHSCIVALLRHDWPLVVYLHNYDVLDFELREHSVSH